jgi:serine/threonine-protein kinase
LDFGIAKVMDVAGGMGSKTRTGVMLGTPGYMSPEQIKNAKAVDPRSDLWSVGVIFYEMIAGQELFDAPTDFAKLTAVITQDPRPIAQISPQLVGWNDFFTRAIARDPARRFASADEMARALLTTARALAGSAPLPTAEFRSVTMGQKSQPTDRPPAPQHDTHVSPQLSTGAQPVHAPSSVQIVQQAAIRNDATLKSGEIPVLPRMGPPIQVGIKPVYAAVIGAVCLVLGFASGFIAAYLGFSK